MCKGTVIEHIIMLKILPVVIVFVIILKSQGEAAAGAAGNPTQALVEFVQGATNPALLPRTDPSQPLKVDFQAAWLDLQDVDHLRNLVGGRFVAEIIWNSSITWDPQDFNGKTAVTVSSKYIYIPRVEVTNLAEKPEVWNNDVVTIFADGTAMVHVEFRGKIYCDDLESNKCKFRAGTGGSFNDVLSFVNPADREFEPIKSMKSLYFNGSHYEIESYQDKVHTNRFQMMKSVFSYEYMDCTFTFREKHGGHHEGPRTTIFKFN